MTMSVTISVTDTHLGQPVVPLGYAKGLHKLGDYQLNILNLPPSERHNMNNILLYGLVRSSSIKKHGHSRILCGVDSHGVQHDEQCLASDLRALDKGVYITVPWLDGVEREVRLRAWVLLGSADFPAAQSCLPCMESPSAHRVCRACNYNQSAPNARTPFSFMTGSSPWTLSAWPELKANLQGLQKLSGKAYSEEASRIGTNKTIFPFHPDYIPYVNPTTCFPQDLMHLLLEGITRHELAWLLFVLITKGHISKEIVDQAIKQYRS